MGWAGICLLRGLWMFFIVNLREIKIFIDGQSLLYTLVNMCSYEYVTGGGKVVDAGSRLAYPIVEADERVEAGGRVDLLEDAERWIFSRATSGVGELAVEFADYYGGGLRVAALRTDIAIERAVATAELGVIKEDEA